MKALLPVILLLALCLNGCRRTSFESATLIVIGVDGMDPSFLERHWDLLPNLRRLRDSGSFQRLQTTQPPQSPVAWSTFLTGLNPSEHGVYDFVQRDPATLSFYSSMGRTDPPRFEVGIGPWRIPLSSARVTALRKGMPFWKILSDHGIPVTTIRVPTNYPPVEAGQALAGMGVPDLSGTFGTFTFFTDHPEEITRDVPGGRIVKVSVREGRVQLPLQGPPNSLRKDQRPSTLPAAAEVDSNKKAVRIEIGDIQAILRQGEWSGWLPVSFALVPGLVHARGMVRIFAKQLTPVFELYMTPINIDPQQPALPISAPSGWSGRIAGSVGPFFTLGIAEDTSALRAGVFNLSEYLRQSRLVFEDERRLLHYASDQFHTGFLFAYFSVIDQNSHMLWQKFEPQLLESYRAVDAEIGAVQSRHPKADLMVMSDHGFTSFRRSFQLNAWLEANHFLAVRSHGPGEGLVNVDWARTRAYALGLNGLYLNLRGREAQGIVRLEAKRELLNQLTKALLQFRDAETGAQVIRSVSYNPTSAAAPDIVVGYAPGYRAAWSAGLGATSGSILEDNHDPWMGDHCIDPAEVPGVLLTKRKQRLADPALRDLSVTVLKSFGIEPLPEMKGRHVF